MDSCSMFYYGNANNMQDVRFLLFTSATSSPRRHVVTVVVLEGFIGQDGLYDQHGS